MKELSLPAAVSSVCGNSIPACQIIAWKNTRRSWCFVPFYTWIMCRRTLRMFCLRTMWFVNHIIREWVLLASVKSYVYVRTRCARFVNFAYVSTRIARTLREHTLLASLRKVFACVSPPFFWQVLYTCKRRTCIYTQTCTHKYYRILHLYMCTQRYLYPSCTNFKGTANAHISHVKCTSVQYICTAHFVLHYIY